MKLDLHALFLQVAAAGGAAALSKEGGWPRVMSSVFSTGEEAASGVAAQLRLLYEQVLLAFEHRCVKKAEGSTLKCVSLGLRLRCLLTKLRRPAHSTAGKALAKTTSDGGRCVFPPASRVCLRLTALAHAQRRRRSLSQASGRGGSRSAAAQA